MSLTQPGYITNADSHFGRLFAIVRSALFAASTLQANNCDPTQVDVSSIEGICKQKLRLDSDAVLDSDNQRALAMAVTQLQRTYEEASAQGGDPAVLDPVADLKLNQLEVVDSVRERQRLIQVDHAALDHFRYVL